jgi:hypothetical protein
MDHHLAQKNIFQTTVVDSKFDLIKTDIWYTLQFHNVFDLEVELHEKEMEIVILFFLFVGNLVPV